jgi:hypothetical protein
MMRRLFRSSKFYTLVLDTVVSVLLTGMGMFLEEQHPEAVEFARYTILAIQPVFVMLIGAIAAEDIAAKKNGANFPIHTQ